MTDESLSPVVTSSPGCVPSWPSGIWGNVLQGVGGGRGFGRGGYPHWERSRGGQDYGGLEPGFPISALLPGLLPTAGPFPWVTSFHTDTPPDLSFFPLLSLKVKIWFQNKRSKYKKLLKQNSGGQEGDLLPRPSSLSPCSPPLPSLWDLPKAGALPAGGYGNTFGAWYPHHSPDVLAPPQML